ncbi:DoxX family protein [Actinomadura sp. 3N508]|uniref:DoxX family protein n=1 Tax=Actinomadura sp. 3N508 TaxID=3375153 RepID=UPI003798A3A0
MDEVAAGLLLVRVVVGLTLAAHGYNKFFGGGRIPGTARWFESIGMRPGRLHALFAASTEIGAGVLFAAGLLTPLAAAGFVGLMLVAAWTVHRENGFFSAGNGWEYNLILAVVAAGVATTGPGAWSLDDAIGLDPGGWGLPIAAGGGLAAGAGLLAVCYRPAPRRREAQETAAAQAETA